MPMQFYKEFKNNVASYGIRNGYCLPYSLSWITLEPICNWLLLFILMTLFLKLIWPTMYKKKMFNWSRFVFEILDWRPRNCNHCTGTIFSQSTIFETYLIHKNNSIELKLESRDLQEKLEKNLSLLFVYRKKEWLKQALFF